MKLKKMGKTEYRAALEALEISQAKMGVFLGVDPRTSRRYIAGDALIPGGSARLLRLMIAQEISVEDAEKLTSA